MYWQVLGCVHDMSKNVLHLCKHTYLHKLDIYEFVSISYRFHICFYFRWQYMSYMEIVLFVNMGNTMDFLFRFHMFLLQMTVAFMYGN